MLSIEEKLGDWLRPASMGTDPSWTKNRQAAVVELVGELEDSLITNLIRLVYSRPVDSDDTMLEFRRTFKKHDANFQMSGNDSELLTLSGCTLAVALHSDTVTAAKVATMLLAASAGKSRVPAVEIDLVGMAEDKLLGAARAWRQRPQFEISASDWEEPTAEDEDEESGETAEEVEVEQPPTVESLAVDSERLEEQCDELVEQQQKMQRLLALQDEEIEILWWLISGWSKTAERSFDEIAVASRAIVIAADLARKNTQPVEMPSLGAIFSRAGVDSSDKFTIPEAVNACGVEVIKRIQEAGTTSATLTPVTLALERALETGCNKDWIVAWSGVTGLDANQAINSANIAMQFYRESLVRSYLSTK